MPSRVVPVSICLALGMMLSACSHNDWGQETIVHAEQSAHHHGPGPAFHSWSAPTVIPVALQGPQAVADTDGPYLLDTGDKLRIFVYGQPNLSRIYNVDHGGWITVPLIGGVKARGITTFDLEKRLKAKLGAQYVKDPHVTVDVQQNRPFFILGEVKTAGQYPYVSGMTVQTAVAIAGGYSERASDRKVVITRRVNGVIDKLRVDPDMPVLPGDTIHVKERFF